jgi:CrcB protein
MWQTYAAIMTGGAFGVGARFFLADLVAKHLGQDFPWGTLLVNVSGCLIIGLFAGLTGPEGTWPTPPLFRQVVAIGILGGFTTFSSFSLQTIELLSNGHLLAAAANIVASLLLCLTATWLGLVVAQRFS